MLSIAAIAVHLAANDPCNDAARVEAQLAALVPDATDVVEIDRDETSLRVTLRRANDQLVARKRVPRERCDTETQAIVAMIGAWESRFDARDEALTLPVPAPVAVPIAVVAAPPFREPPRQGAGFAWSLDAAFLSSVAGGTYGAGASGEVLLGRKGFPLGVWLGVVGESGHDQVVGSGRARWSVVGASIVPDVLVLSRKVRLDLHADLVLGALLGKGHGFATNETASVFDPELGGGARLSIPRWNVTPFLDVTALGRLRSATLVATTDTSTETAKLPRFDLWVRVGVAYGRRK